MSGFSILLGLFFHPVTPLLNWTPPSLRRRRRGEQTLKDHRDRLTEVTLRSRSGVQGVIDCRADGSAHIFSPLFLSPKKSIFGRDRSRSLHCSTKSGQSLATAVADTSEPGNGWQSQCCGWLGTGLRQTN